MATQTAEPVTAATAQMSLREWVAQLDEAGQLYRHQGQARVDELLQKSSLSHGADVDLAILPLFSHHLLEGQAFVDSGRLVTRNMRLRALRTSLPGSRRNRPQRVSTRLGHRATGPNRLNDAMRAHPDADEAERHMKV